MRYVFAIQDEKTIINDTVKVFIHVSGPADADREDLESRVQEGLKKLLPEAKWVFSGLSISTGNGYPLFTTIASARIPVKQNDNLEQRARDVSNKKVNLRYHSQDQSVPLHLQREGYAEMRSNLLKMAEEEVSRLNGGYEDSKDDHGPRYHIEKIQFTEETNSPMLRSATSTANAYIAESAGSGIGYSEKIFCHAQIIITDDADNAIPVEIVS